MAPMPVKHSEIAALWPPTLMIGFGDVHDDRHSIFIEVFDQSMKSISGISLDGTV